MTLDDQQRQDLITFAIGTADPESTARTQELLGASPEARAFMANVVLLGKTLRPQEGERLSRPAAAKLAASIRQRATEKRTRRHRPSARRVVLSLAIAASLLIVVAESFWLGALKPRDTSIGYVAHVPFIVAGGLPGPLPPEVVPLQPGETVGTSDADDTPVIVLNEGGRMAARPQSRVRIHDSRSATLDFGTLYWDCPTEGTLTAGAAIYRFLQAQAEVNLYEHMVTCSLFRGSGSVDIAGRRELLTPGETLITPWNGEIQRTPTLYPPTWALHAFQKQAESELDRRINEP